MDYGHRYSDKKISAVDRELRKTYRTAQKELKEKLKDFNERFAKKNREMKEKLSAEEITKEEYRDWLTGQVFVRRRWQEQVNMINAVLLDHNRQAVNIVNNSRFDVFAENYNFSAFLAEKNIVGSFNVYNAEAVARLLTDDPQLLPQWNIDKKKDYKWNQQKVNNIVRQGIIQGKSVEEITDDLTVGLSAKNESRMRLFARTAINGAENAGRQQQMHDAAAMGIETRKQWVAVHDGKTRDAHRDLDGKEVPEDQPFKSQLGDIMFPSDPHATPANTYNCRCTMITIYPKYADPDRADKYKDLVIDGQNYEEWKKGKVKKGEVQPTTPKDNATFTETLANAYEYHRIHNGLRSAPYDPKSTLQIIKEEVPTLDDKSRATMEKTISGLVDKYDTPITAVKTMDKTEAVRRRNTYAYMSRSYSTETGEMMINPLKCGKYDTMMQNLHGMKKSGYLSNVPDDKLEQYVFAHEFGHSLLIMRGDLKEKYNFVGADYQKIESLRKEVRGIYRSYAKEIGEIDTARKNAEFDFIVNPSDQSAQRTKELEAQLKEKRISKYSLENPDEFFAESFVYTEFGGTDNKYANKVREIIDREFRRDNQ